jgi:hypothetical protein
MGTKIKYKYADSSRYHNTPEGALRDSEEQRKKKFVPATPEVPQENYEPEIDKKVEKAKQERSASREEGWKHGEDIMARKTVGLDPEQRRALQYEANKGIQRSMQSANRRLLGDQGQRGIGKGSGVGFAQQLELERAGRDAQGTADRDITKLDKDLELKKKAAIFNVSQGEAAQTQMDRQRASDDLQLYEERKRARAIEEKLNNLMARI